MRELNILINNLTPAWYLLCYKLRPPSPSLRYILNKYWYNQCQRVDKQDLTKFTHYVILWNCDVIPKARPKIKNIDTILFFHLPRPISTKIKSRSTASARLSTYAKWLQKHRQTQGQRSNGSARRAHTDKRTDGQTDATKYIISQLRGR